MGLEGRGGTREGSRPFGAISVCAPFTDSAAVQRRIYAGNYSNPVVSDESECVVLMLLPFHHLCERSIHPSALPAPGPTSPRAPSQAMCSQPI